MTVRSGSSDESGVLPTRPIRVLVVGGLDRLETFYRDAPSGVVVETAFTHGAGLEGRAMAVDAIVLVAGVVSHAAAATVRAAARLRRMPLIHARSGSVSQVRAALAEAVLAVRGSAVRRAS